MQRLAHRVVWVNPHRGKDGLRARPARDRCCAAALRRARRRPLAARRSPRSWRWSVVREVIDELMKWWDAGETVGVGTVVATFQSAPRPAGASMLVGPAGEAVGSVSGGCVEGAVYELSQSVVESGAAGAAALRRLRRRRVRGRAHLRRHPRRVRREGEPGDLPRARRHRRRHRGRPPGRAGHRDRAPGPGVAGSAARRTSRTERWADRSAASAPPPPSPTTRCGLLAVGPQRDAHLRPRRRAPRRGDAGLRLGVRPGAAAAGLRRHRLRGGGGPRRRVPRLPRHRVRRPARLRHHTRGSRDADEVVVSWPHKYLKAEVDAGRIDRRTVICVLTHDPKFDVPVLEIALRLPEVAYVGAMGSRRTHDDRLTRLREAGLTDDELARLSSPIGLDLGARTPGGDRRQHRRRDHRRPVGRLRRAALGDRRPHPRAPPAPRELTVAGATVYRHRDDLLPGAVTSAVAYESHGLDARQPPRTAIALDHLHRLRRRPGACLPARSRERRRVRPGARDVVRRDGGGPAPGGGRGRAAGRPAAACSSPCTPWRRRSVLGCRAAELRRPGRPRPRGARRGGRRAARRGSVRGRADDARLDVVQQLAAARVTDGAGPAYARRCGVPGSSSEASRRPVPGGATWPREVLLEPAPAAHPDGAPSSGCRRSSCAALFRFDAVIGRLAAGETEPGRGRCGDGLCRPEPPDPGVPADGRLQPDARGWSRSAETSKTAATRNRPD